MSSASIRIQISQKQMELDQAYKELSKSNKDYEQVEAFKSKIKSTYSSFMSSIDNRRSKLNKITGLLDSVNSARGYHQRADGLLSGREFSCTDENYQNMETAVSSELSRINDEISVLENKIASLKGQISSLEYEYQRAIAREEAEQRARERAAING